MEAIAEQLHDDVGSRVAAIDPHHPVAGPAEDLLGRRTRQAGANGHPQILPLQPAVATAGDLGSGDDVEQFGDAVPAFRPQRHDPPMQQVLIESSVAKPAIERHREPFSVDETGKIDDRPRRTRRGDVADAAPIDQREIAVV